MDLFLFDNERFGRASSRLGTHVLNTVYEDDSQIARTIILSISLLPLSFAGYILVHDVLRRLVKGFPSNPFSRLLRLVHRPFTDFLRLSELEEYDPSNPVRIETPQWKRWVSVSVGVPAIFGWMFFAINEVLRMIQRNERYMGWWAWYSFAMCAAWAYMTLRISTKPIHSAPMGNILFYASQISYSLMFLITGQAIFQALVLGALTSIPLYLLGTFPMTSLQPSRDVSPPSATPSSSISSPEDSVSFWEWATFSFPSLYYPVSGKKRLDADDVWKLSPWFLHRNLFRKYLAVQESSRSASSSTRSEQIKPKKRRSLIVFLLRANSRDIILDIVIELYKAVAGFIPPYALKHLLASLTSDSDVTKSGSSNKAHYYALLTFIAHLSFAQCDLAQGWCTRRCYERTRGVIFCNLHWKALKRRVVGGAAIKTESKTGDEPDKTENKHEKEQSADLGKVVNLMQGDAYAVAQRFWELSPLFGTPVRIGIALWFLHGLLGPAAFAGVVVILLAYLINWPLIKWNIYITRNSWKARDARMKGVNELFQGIRFLKMIGWESGWTKRVLESREVELAWRVQGYICSAIIVFVWTWIPSATALASFIAYTLVARKPLTVSIAFTALGVFEQLQSSMTALPGHIFALFYAYVSMQRIDTFLTEEEVPDWASSLKGAATLTTMDGSNDTEKIGFENATLEWYRLDSNVDSKASEHQPLAPELVNGINEVEEDLVQGEDVHQRLDQGRPFQGEGAGGLPSAVHIIQEEVEVEAGSERRDHSTNQREQNEQRPFKLIIPNLLLPLGKLTLVTGNTGAGKTAFLVGLLGEMKLIKGTIHLDKSNHRVAYCAQSSWLEHATIRDNIVYGSPLGYDEARYDAVVAACALDKDLEILPAGDMTEIGEKGVSLSGGQRARVALARAIYSPARTILLDDPLAAVDMHTARHIVQDCLGSSLMQNRTVILVTHHVKLCLPLADFLVEIDGGKIVKSGRVAEFGKSTIKTMLAEIGGGEDKIEEPKSFVNDADALPEETATPERDNRSSRSTTNVDESSDADPKATPKWRLSTAEAGKLVEEEARAEGRVSWKTYRAYVRAAGYWTWGVTFLLMASMGGINTLNQFFLSKWGEAYNQPASNQTYPHLLFQLSPSASYVANSPSIDMNHIPIVDELPPPSENVLPWLLIYFFLSILGAITVLLFICLGFYASLIASRTLFRQMLLRLAHAPTRFFDVTPIGRILNRFVADIGAVDGAVNNSLRGAIAGALSFVISFCVIVYVVPAFAPVAVVIAWLYIRLAPPYVRTSRDLRRLESVALSPAFAGFDELLHGLVHVRAFGVEQRYQDRFYKRVDTFQAFDHSYWLVSFWLRWRYDCLGSVVVYLTTLFALAAQVTPGFAAVVILNAGMFAEASRQLVRVLAQVELDFNSVERIGEYLLVQQEAPLVISNSRPPAYWPSSATGISVEDVWIRYSPTSPDVLKGISFEIKPGEKIGIVGRTGSGKSTLCAAFLRIIECWKGRIMIDGVDIATIGLEDLRTRLTIVSQDVALFEGTVRTNLDPFGEHTDEECWDVLRRCHLTSQNVDNGETRSNTEGNEVNKGMKTRSAVFNSLESPISAGGGSLSAGQKQLVALARAMMRRAKVVLTDEATSAIDLELDDRIQQTIRDELGDATVITIAHRLRTVIEYDRILVLDHGEIAEYDTPAALLKEDGIFARLCRGSADWEELRQLVKDN